MRHWLENRDPASTFQFDAPEHLKNHTPVLDVLECHGRVFLSQEKGWFTGGISKWADVVPLFDWAASIHEVVREPASFDGLRKPRREHYDWDYSEHVAVRNPDYASKTAGAIATTSKTIVCVSSDRKTT